MRSDPIVDEVRRVRHEIEREFGSDREAFYRHLCEVQKKFGQRLVTLTPKEAKKRSKSSPASRS